MEKLFKNALKNLKATQTNTGNVNLHADNGSDVWTMEMQDLEKEASDFKLISK